ncbi:MAG: glycosyltransferase [Planctomycetota bacterium]
MKIVFFIHSLVGGGAERVVAGLASGLADRGHEVVLLTLDDGEVTTYSLSSQVQRIGLNLLHPASGMIDGWLRTRERIATLRRAVSSLEPSVVISFCDSNNLLMAMATRHRDRDFRVWLCERSDPTMQRLSRVKRWLQRRSYPMADRVLVQTEAARQAMQRGLMRGCPEKVGILDTAIDIPRPMRELPFAETSKTIVFTGRLDPEKGVDRLIEAFAKLQEASLWRLRIVGRGCLDGQLRDLALRLGVSEQIEFLDWQSCLEEQFKDATMFALPSHYEGMSSSLIEAMAMGIPVVALDTQVGSVELIDHAQNGWLARGDDAVEGLRVGIQALIDDPSMRQRLGSAAAASVAHLTWDRLLDQIESAVGPA